MFAFSAQKIAPKAELHCHLEGTVSPSLALRLAARHGLDLSPIISPEGAYTFKSFAEFLVAYDSVSDAIRTPEDYYQVLYDYYRGAAQEGLIYGEMFFAPEHAERLGMSYASFVEALSIALDDVERDFGVVARLILTVVLHLGAENAEATARLAQTHPHPKVAGFGMAGDECFLEPAAFARAYKMAGDAGLSLTAHAGELAGPESVRRALSELNVVRIGHGVRAIEDASLMLELRDRGTTLEVCPSSNVALELYPSLTSHPIAQLTAFGVKTTLGSDDPPFVLTTIGEEYAKVQAAHQLSSAEMAGFTERAIAAAFCGPDEKARLMAAVSTIQQSPA